jgi:predicted permease
MFGQVLQISLPVFLVIALGALLRRAGLIGEGARRFLSQFPYLICLPILVFLEVSSKDFAQLLNFRVIGTIWLTTWISASVLWVLTWRLKPALRGPVILSGFFANSAYLGFPLSQRAFGSEGLSYAGIANAFGMPLFVVLGTICMHLGGKEKGAGLRALKAGILNPIVLAALGGVLFALGVHTTGLGEAWMSRGTLAGPTRVVITAADMVGQMGLPLALLAIGASLRMGHVREQLPLVLAGSGAKLLLCPALGIGISWLLFGTIWGPMDPAARGVSVLILACPLSVSSWVISQSTRADSDYLSALLLVSTAGACATIPLWLLLLL